MAASLSVLNVIIVHKFYVTVNASSSGVGAASSGKLTFMVGGAEEEFNAAKELLTCMGSNIVYCGQVGTGQVRNFPNY